MDSPEALEAELKKLIIDELVLEDLVPEDIESTDPLFVDGLGLDSIDALEIAMVLEQRFGVSIGEDAEANLELFASVRSLAAFIAENRSR